MVNIISTRNAYLKSGDIIYDDNKNLHYIIIKIRSKEIGCVLYNLDDHTNISGRFDCTRLTIEQVEKRLNNIYGKVQLKVIRANNYDLDIRIKGDL